MEARSDNYMGMSGAEGRSRTDTGLLPPVFETGASTIPPLRHAGLLTANAARPKATRLGLTLDDRILQP